jgi:hypothetical protein
MSSIVRSGVTQTLNQSDVSEVIWLELHKAIDACKAHHIARLKTVDEQAKSRSGVWPTLEMEADMLKDASYLRNSVNQIEKDCGNHVIALLTRIRELEKELRK